MLFALMVTAVLVFGIVTVLNGDEVAGQTSTTRILEPMPTQPDVRWKVDAASLFGSEFTSAGVHVEVATDDIVLVRASPIALGKPGALLALDPDTGRPRWETPRIGWDNGCAMSRDGRLGCTRLLRERGAVVKRITFIGPHTGADEATATIQTAGSSTITRAGDGFVVLTRKIENIAVPEELSDSVRLRVVAGVEEPRDEQVTITRFDSQGRQNWTVRPPINQDRLVVSDAGNLFAVGDWSGGGVTVYRLDTGESLFSAHSRTDDDGHAALTSVVLHPAGFVASSSRPGDYRVEFFDSHGGTTGELAGWRVVPGSFNNPATTVDGDRLSLTSGAAVGIASIRDHALRWETRTSGTQLELMSERYAATQSDDYSHGSPGSQTWTLFDAQTGDQQGQFTVGFGQGFIGFDGTRALFDGEPEADQRPNLPSLTSFDAKTGTQVWRLPPPSPTTRWQVMAGDGTVPTAHR